MTFEWIEIDKDWYELYLSKYIEDFVDVLKDTVPKDSRNWDPKKKCWKICASYEDEVFSILEEHDFEDAS